VFKLLCQTWRVSAKSLSITSLAAGGSRLPNWGSSPPLPSPLLPSLFLSLPFPYLSLSPSLPLEVGPLNTARGLGRAVSSLSGVWGEAPAEIEFGAF